MLTLQADDEEQDATFKALFDRGEQYLEFAQTLKEAKTLLKIGTEVELRKALRSVGQQLLSLQAIDFFPAKDQDRALSGLNSLRNDVENHRSLGEPKSRANDIKRHQ